MDAEGIIDLLRSRFGEGIISSEAEGLHPHVVVSAGSLVGVCKFLRDDESLRFDLLRCVTAIDWPDRATISVVYDLVSIEHGHVFSVKVELDRDKAEVASVSQVWRTAEWHEREAYDLMGVKFLGHSDLRRILLPEDWPGHPLRKDYQESEEYHGISTKL